MTNPVLRGRMILLLIVAFFVLPVIVAKTVLEKHWYQSGVTNHGQLFNPEISLAELNVSNPLQQKSWQLAYVVPKQCQQSCLRQLYLLSQSHMALGKYQQRVTPVLMMTPDSDQMVDTSKFAVIRLNGDAELPFSEADYLIVDPLGQLVMRYPEVEEQAMMSQSKDLLADFRKLLKLSRIG
ncbi:hypothetical protein [Vibrio sp.]|uniref:hypothetical protein n=1 Tax=Vibrio sp. TaxID=678 RepID=UPI003D0E20DA